MILNIYFLIVWYFTINNIFLVAFVKENVCCYLWARDKQRHGQLSILCLSFFADYYESVVGNHLSYLVSTDGVLWSSLLIRVRLPRGQLKFKGKFYTHSLFGVVVLQSATHTRANLVDKFTYLGSSVLSTEQDIDTRLTKAWTAIDRLSVIWKSDHTYKMKRTFSQAANVLILLCGCTTWTITKRLEKKLDGNYTRMLRAILNTFWRQHPTKQQLYGHVQPITKTIQIRTRHVGHCRRSRDELIMLYSHVPYHNDTINRETHDDKDAVINDPHRKTQEDFFIKYFTSHFICKVSKKVTQSLRVRGSWRPNITEIFWPQSYGRQRCVFLVLHGFSTGALESNLLGAGFPYYNASISVSNYTACPQLYSPVSWLVELNCPLFNSSALYYLQTPTRWYGHATATSSDI